MLKQVPAENKLASLGTIGLLFLAGITGTLFLQTNQAAHAATPTISLSTISNGVLTATTSGTPGGSIVITGSGFESAAHVSIFTTVGAVTVPWLTLGTCATANSGSSGIDSLVSSGCLTTSAIGDFQVKVTIPSLPGGGHTITVSDGTNTAGAAFTIQPVVTITYAGNNFGFPEEAINPAITLVGFGSSESVTVATPMWTTTSFSCITTTLGSCSESRTTQVADTTGGLKAITATGATSGLVATTTFMVNPWAAFYNFLAGPTTYSFIGIAPTAVLVEAHGLAAGKIAANSITIGGVATSHSAVNIGSNGAFAGQGGQLIVAPTSQVPFGPVSVVIDGTSFSYALGNIALGAGTWGGVLISSILGTASSTGVMTTDASSYKPGTGFTVSTTSPAPAQNVVAFFGYGFVTFGESVVIGNGGSGLGSVTYHDEVFRMCGGTCDADGAVFATATLGDTPWSAAATPTIPNSYAPAISQASGPANILGPSFGITPWIQSPAETRVDYTTSTEAITAHGFSTTEQLTLEIGGSAMVSGGTCTTSTAGACTTAAGQVPDLAGGIQSISIAGTRSGVIETGSLTYLPVANSATGATLSVTVGGAGQTTTIRTGNGYGVHGLTANTVYSIVWNAVSGSINVGSFTSTATGGIPNPGVQFTIPSDEGGIHILDLQSSTGVSALFAGQVLSEYAPTEAPFFGSLSTAYGDMLFNTIAVLHASPSVANVESPETLSGTGLLSSQSYVVALGIGPGTVSLGAPALGTFTSTSTGTIPAGVSVALPDTPTALETGTVSYFSVQTTAHFGVTTISDAYAQFVLAANANLNPISALDGQSVTLTAHALNPDGVYDVVFNYVQSSVESTSFTGTVVGSLAPNSLGAGSTTFDVPAATQGGTYVVQLTVATQGVGGAPVGAGVLDVPPSLTVGSLSTTTVSCSPAIVVVGSSSTCTATVTGSSPTGTVTWTSSSTTGQFSSGTECTLSAGSCSVEYADAVSGSPVITATYDGDATNTGSNSSFVLTVTPRSSSTSLNCAKPFTRGVPITCTATVTDTSPGTPIVPGGTVSFSADGAGKFSSTTCSLSGSGATATCTVTFTPRLAFYKMVASYTGDAVHLGSSAHQLLLVKR